MQLIFSAVAEIPAGTYTVAEANNLASELGTSPEDFWSVVHTPRTFA